MSVNPPTHKAIAAVGLGDIGEVDVTTPIPAAGEVLVEMKYASLSPVDVYQVDRGFLLEKSNYPHVLGLSGAGFVKSVGNGVEELKEGDKVTAFTYGSSRTKPFQKYCIVPKPLVAKVPDAFPLDEAASMPDSYVTAMYTLFSSATLTLPLPPVFPAKGSSLPPNADVPILVYGAGSSSGQYMVQILKLSGYTNIIAAASSHHHPILSSLGAKVGVDYHSSKLADEIVEKAGRKVEIVVDCIGAKPSILAYAGAVAESARIAFLMPIKDGEKTYNGVESAMHVQFPAWVKEALPTAQLIPVASFLNQSDPIGKDIFMPKILPQLLGDGLIKANPLLVMGESDGSMIERTNKALDLLRNNKANGRKVLAKIDY